MSSNAVLDRCNKELDEADNGLTLKNDSIDSYKNAGVDGDNKHDGGYHRFRKDLPDPDEYSSGSPRGVNTSPRDLGGPDNIAAATDMYFDPEDMVTVSRRIQAAIDRHDPAMDDVREVNMWFGGNSDPVNRDQVLGWRQNYPPNGSHKSHIHAAWFRDCCNDYAKVKAFYNIVEGKSETEELDMALLNDIGKTVANIGIRVTSMATQLNEITTQVRRVLPGSANGRGWFVVKNGVLTYVDEKVPGRQVNHTLDSGDGFIIVSAIRALASGNKEDTERLLNLLDKDGDGQLDSVVPPAPLVDTTPFETPTA